MTAYEWNRDPGACERVRARLVELCDGGLHPLERERDLGHLESCASCAREHARHERWLDSAVRALTGPLGEWDSARAGVVVELSRAAAGPAVHARSRTPGPKPGALRASLRGIGTAAAAASTMWVLSLVQGAGDGARCLQAAWGGSLRVLHELTVPHLALPREPTRVLFGTSGGEG